MIRQLLLARVLAPTAGEGDKLRLCPTNTTVLEYYSLFQ